MKEPAIGSIYNSPLGATYKIKPYISPPNTVQIASMMHNARHEMQDINPFVQDSSNGLYYGGNITLSYDMIDTEPVNNMAKTILTHHNYNKLSEDTKSNINKRFDIIRKNIVKINNLGNILNETHKLKGEFPNMPSELLNGGNIEKLQNQYKNFRQKLDTRQHKMLEIVQHLKI
jgi:hypothetical protein